MSMERDTVPRPRGGAAAPDAGRSAAEGASGPGVARTGHSASALLLLGVWLGLVVGWLDVLNAGFHKFVLGEFINRSPHVLWMAPTAYVLMYMLPAAALALLYRRWPRVVSFRTAAFVLMFGAAMSILIVLFYQRIHDVALLALAAGIAAHASGVVTTGGPAFSRLVRRSTPVMALLVVLAAAGVGAWRTVVERSGASGLAAARPGAPNVLLIILDTVRSASLGLYGYERPTTPRLEEFAARGVVFEQAIAPSSWTLPSHASMFTGREPQDLSVGWLSPLDDADPTLAEVLRDRGYATGGFVANLRYGMYETGLNRGFLRYSDYQVSPGQLFLHSGLGRFLAGRRALRTLIGSDEVVARRTADDINQDFLGWVDDIDDERPFFAFLNYYDAHDPYLPPDEFFRRITGVDRPHRLSPLRRLTVRERRHGVRPEDLRLEIDSYDASIAYLDDRVGLLLDDLERRGVLDNTVVVITSDHGEEFGEHGVYFHGHSLYLPSLHVPLIVAYPGGAAGVRVGEPVSLTDLAATIADLAGVEGRGGLAGRSLASTWRAPGVPGGPLRSELQKGIRLPEWYPVAIGDMTSVVADGMHYIRNGDGREELFDLQRDPHERNDLAMEPWSSERLQYFRSLLQQ